MAEVDTVGTHRLTTDDLELARRGFALMADVFGTAGPPLGDRYLTDLLAREDVWAVVATVDGEVVGAVTAHLLPMTRAEESELFVYDLAVSADRQRRGVGTALMRHLTDAAWAAGVACVFVPADNEDGHVLEFYRATGGAAEAVTIFTYLPPESSSR